MIPEGNRKPNIDRFLGYQDTYDRYRPQAPEIVIQLLTTYLGGRPSLVADVGCGTGLSTFLWKDAADAVVGVEPNPDMLDKAKDKLSRTANADNLSFIQAFSNQLPFAPGSIDIITCSQSFHWMEPSSTLQEFARCLRTGGVFAAYDCDWPLMLQPDIEMLYNRLIEQADSLLDSELSEAERAYKWDKNQHLTRIKDSKTFSFAREIVFHNTEACDAERYVSLALSQGGVQTVLKLGASLLEREIAEFRAAVEKFFEGQTLQILLSYRMRVGVK